MANRVDDLDLGRLRLTAGEGRRIQVELALAPFELGGEHYPVVPERIPATLELARTTGNGYALRLRFEARVDGPCMRCLSPAAPTFEIDVREVSQPRGGEELQSPYVDDDGVLDLGDWARDALALALPTQILCKPDCAGLCSVCGADLNQAGPDHHHEPTPDPRWAKLSEIRFDG